jgi:putative ABC transport system permease protein
MAAAGAVLLIASANLASLMLSRAAARRGELAIRIACGATRARLVRQMVMEALPLALTGGALGLLAAPAGRIVLTSLVPTSMPEGRTSALSLPLLIFAGLLSVTTGVLFSIVPAVQAGKRSVRDSLQGHGRSMVGGSGRLTRDVLVVAQVAFAFVLLVSATLMMRTLSNLHAIDLGFQPERLLTMRTTLPRDKYADTTARADFYDRVLDGVKRLPGVQSAAYISTPPFMSQGNTRSYGVDGQAPAPGTAADALYRVATLDYLATLGVKLVEGRLFEASDGMDNPPVIIVNETLARRHWPSASALGHRIRFGLTPQDDASFTIVGVVKDVRERGHLLEMKPGVYVSYAQASARDWPEFLVVRTTNDPLELAPAARKVIGGVDSDQPVSALRTMDAIIDSDVTDRQQQLTLLGAFGGIALALSALGLYGVLAYNVTQRRQEIGLRMALGASRTSVFKLVVTRGVTLTLVGLAAGFLLATALTRTIAALLYGVAPDDASTLAAVTALLVGVAVTACSLPARRAMRISPLQALKED